MYQIYKIYKDPVYRFLHHFKYWDLISMIPFVWLSLKIRLQYFFFLLSSGHGFPQSDDSRWYINYAYSLMEHKGIGLDMNDILYIGYNLLLTLLLALFKSQVTVLFIQSVTAGLCVILVYKIAQMLFNRTTAIIASYIYCYHAWGITLWATYILSDSFFISLLLLCVYLLLKVMQTNIRVYKTLFVCSSLYLLLFRPAGIMTVAFMMVYIVINTHRKTLIRIIKKHKLAIGGSLTAAVIVFVYFYTGHKLDPLINSMKFNAKLVLYNVYARGRIYDIASPHDHLFKPDYHITIMNSLLVSFIINNWDHIMVIYVKRVIAFIGRWVWDTDLTSAGGIKRFAENLLPTALFLTGTIAAMVNGRFRKASIAWLLILNVFVFCIIFFIDGMYRYKAPAVPFIAMVVAYGTYSIIYCVILVIKYCAGKLLWNKKRDHIPQAFN